VTPTRVLVWHWGRFGAGPRFARELASGLNQVPCVTALLSLSRQAELMGVAPAPSGALAVDTYTGLPGFLARMLSMPLALPGLMHRIRALRPDLAICAMPAPLDALMGAALRRLGVPYWVVVHDADSHPGDGFPLQMALQRRLAARATGLIALSGHVAGRLRAQGDLRGRRLILSEHPPFAFGPPPAPPGRHDGPLRLLFFGRLLPYKGLDLFADALRLLSHRDDLEVVVAGQGPNSAALAALRAMSLVTVDQRWIPEDEIGSLLAWSDAVVLSHVEASQSGVAAAAIAAGRWVVATRVGGLVEQLADRPQARLCAPNAEALAAGIVSLIEHPPSEAAYSGAGDWARVAAALIRDIGGDQLPNTLDQISVTPDTPSRPSTI
jgi:glycosyltransferase involved in cell wall biosynthesis